MLWKQHGETSVRRFGWLILPLLFLSSCSSLFYFPDRNLYFPFKKTGYAGQELWFRASDGTRLFAWYFPALAQSPKGTIVQFHGNAENLSSHYLSLAWLTRHGYHLFTFDYRGYGRSDGAPDQKGTYLDGMAALQKARELHLTAQKGKPGIFVVYGQSLGGAIAMRVLDDFKPREEVDFVVMDSTFHSYSGVARTKLAGSWLTWLLSPLASLLVSDEYGATEAVQRNKTPLLVIHDENDPSVPFAAGQEIFDLAKSEKELWQMREGNHTAVFADPHVERREAFVRILDALPRREPKP